MNNHLCRICGSDQIHILPLGIYAEFFCCRVDVSKDKHRMFSREDSILGATEFAAPKTLPQRAFRKLKRMLTVGPVKPAKPFRTFVQACTNCHGITPCHEYSYQDLLGLYHDYRSETYNRERIAVEPTYKLIAHHVGSHPQELKSRNAATDAFLRRNQQYFRGGLMMDYGGSDGRFVPTFVFEQFEAVHILDASEVPVHPSLDALKATKISVAEPHRYSLLTCMHVLEHVGNPRYFIQEILKHLVPGGILYIEVPLDLSKAICDEVHNRILDSPIGIHEHLNLFDRTSILALFASIPGLEPLDDSEDIVDFGWAKALVGRFLVRTSA